MRLPEDVLLELLQYMCLPTLLAFGSAHRRCNEWVVKHLDKTLDSRLTRYVEDPTAFRAALRMLGGVLSGSFVLSFLMMNDLRDFTPNDLDVYLPNSVAARFARYLMDVEGYILRRTARVPYGTNDAHRMVVVLQKHGMQIDVIPSNNDSALLPIAHFWGSHLMNFITADTFCVAYPQLTFQSRCLLSPFQLLHSRYPGDVVLGMMRKYALRGIDFRVRPYAWDVSHPRGFCKHGSGCPRLRRFFGDRFCLTGRLSADFKDCGYLRRLPSEETVAWWRGGDPCDDDCDMAELLPERTVPAAMMLVVSSLPDTL
ncbi:hypothetical protein VTO73DRAFT_4854 [Trametes versicolor]